MTRLLSRLTRLVLTLFGMLLGVFAMLHIAPGDPVDVLLDTSSQFVTQEQIDQLRAHYGLDRPLHEQFLAYAGGVVRGDLGTSFRTKTPVADDIALHLTPTLHLAFAGMAVALLVGVPAGVIAAVRRNTAADYVALTLSIVGLSAPSFWLGILLLYVFSYRLGWFPLVGDGLGRLDSTLTHLVLPAIVVGATVAALLARLTRSAVLETLAQDYVRTARAKGLREHLVIAKHVLKNAAVPVSASAGTMFAYLVTGAVVVEIVFSRHGLGALMISAINERDFPLVQALVLVYGVLIVTVNTLTDLVTALLDPRAEGS